MQLVSDLQQPASSLAQFQTSICPAELNACCLSASTKGAGQPLLLHPMFVCLPLKQRCEKPTKDTFMMPLTGRTCQSFVWVIKNCHPNKLSSYSISELYHVDFWNMASLLNLVISVSHKWEMSSKPCDSVTQLTVTPVTPSQLNTALVITHIFTLWHIKRPT